MSATTTLPADRKKSADVWMREGIKQHNSFNRNFKAAKQNALNSGFFFLSARACLENGEWGDYCALYSDQIKSRTIQSYMLFAEEALEWAKAEHPKLNGEKLQASAVEMVMLSPRGYVALCRELGHMRKFGEYDSVKYAAQKRLANGTMQLELEFDKVCSWLDPLRRIGDANFSFVFPDGKTEDQALHELDETLGAIRDRVRAKLTRNKTIDA